MIRSDLETLARPDGRLPGTPGHEAAAHYLLTRFVELGLRPYSGLPGFEHTFDAGSGVVGRNLIAVVPGRNPDAAPLLLAAHYDSVISAPCADDNAAAVATMLAVAGRIAPGELERDLIIASFDTEEPPYFCTERMGSVRFVADALVRPVHVAVVLDLVGHPFSLGPLAIDPHLLFALGSESHPGLPATLAGLDLPVVPTRNDRIGDLSDHGAFRLAGMPYLFFSCGQWPAYHTRADTLDGVDISKLERLAPALVQVLAAADRAELGPAVDHDTTAVEIAALHRHLGDAGMAMAAGAIGVERISTREHLDRLVPVLHGLAIAGDRWG